jgi:hypothetical protein
VTAWHRNLQPRTPAGCVECAGRHTAVPRQPGAGLHYAGAVGTGFSEQQLRDLCRRLDALASAPPAELLVAGDDLGRTIRWVRRELIAELERVTLRFGGPGDEPQEAQLWSLLLKHLPYRRIQPEDPRRV